MQHDHDRPFDLHPQPPPLQPHHLAPFGALLAPIDGPITSPEAQATLQQGDPFSESILDPVPRLRSPPSTCRPQSPSQSKDSFDLIPGLETTHHTRPITPENDDDYLHDEPSAVLASRVISAHDNPSPPPSPPIPDPLLDAPLIDFSSPAGHPVQAIDNQPPSTPPYDHPESNTRILQDLFAPVSPSPRSSARADFLPPPFSFEVAPSLALLAPEDVDIAFTPTDASPVQKIRNHPSEYLPSHHEEPEQSNEGSDVAHDSAEEQAVAASLQADISSVTPSPIEVEPPSPPLPIVEPPDQSEVQTPPLRRSTRPRKSIAPNLLDVNSPGSRQSSPLSGSAKKGKRRALSPLLGEHDTPRPLRQNRESTDIDRVGDDAPPTFSRELGSLSPTSKSVLSRLASPEQVMAGSSTLPPPNLFSQVMQLHLPPSTPSRASTPSRTLQTVHSTMTMGSPSKLFLTPSARDDPNRTPARRIPAGPTVVTGHVQSSPLKGPDYNLVLNPSRSGGPARRILDTPTIPTPVIRRMSSPTRPQVPTRSRSVEPQLPPSTLSKSKLRGGSAEPLHPPSATKAKNSRLPFPIVARAEPIPEEPEAGPSQKGDTSAPPKTPATTTKSLLKQPSSRIPRIGAKPYARSTTTSRDAKAKGSGSLEADSKATVSKGKSTVTVPKRQLTPQVVIPSSKNSLGANMNGLGPSNLKRKRETPESPPSPAKMRPIVVVRQALSVSRTEPSTTTGSSRSTSSSSSAAQRVYGKARNAPPPTIPSEPSTSKSQVFSPPPPPSIKSPPPPPTRIPSPSHIPIPSQSIESVLESTISNSQADRSSSPPAPTNPSTSDVEDDLTSVSVPTSSERSTSRRITRLRKPTNTDGSDVFRERPTASRRKAQTRSEAEGFGGLSAVALKAMTSTNTTRNQHYLSVTIATEVVKKDGNRPESPVMKVKTTLQKQQEEKDKQRQERAERRARRSAGDTDIDNSIELEASKVESSVDGESDGEVLLPGGFRKGAGDEDDYQAPGQVVNGSEDRLAAKRRVAWDRGLFTTIYLDEVKLGSRPPPKENMSLKGCLAPACKTVQLDLHGNPPNAEIPLADLVVESVVVKRFLYDNDVELVEELEPPPLPVKNTRSRTKKQNR